VTDDSKRIADAVARMVKDGCELVVTTGGLSVDPDDVTRLGIRKAGAKIFFYGTPVLPGAMFLYAQLDGVPIMGLPACVYFHPSTLFDLLLPRVLAGDPVDRNTVAALGHGGLCLDCEVCRFPVCPFGR
jgi:molybdopterin biosynthesis enzyme